MKKITYKLLTILLAIGITLGTISTILADGDTKGVEISTTVSQVYTWYVSSDIVVGEGSIEVGITENTIPYGKQLVISYKGDNDEVGKHYLVDANNSNNKIEYQVNGCEEGIDGIALISPAGEVKVNNLVITLNGNKDFSGTYNDHLTFVAEITD